MSQSFNFNNFKKTFQLFIPHLTSNASSRRRCGAAVSLIILDIIASSLVPYFAKNIVDSLTVSLAASFAVSLILLCIFWTFEKIAEHAQEIIFFPCINNSIRGITRAVVDHIHKIPLQSYQTLSMPEVLSCIKRISMSSRNFFRVLFLLAFPTTIKLLIAAFVTLKLGWLGLLLIPSYLICITSLYKGTQWYMRAREQAWEISDTVTMRVNDSIANTKIIRPSMSFEMDSIQNLLDEEARLWYRSNTRLHLVHIFIGMLLGLTLLIILYAAIVAIQQGTLTLGDFVLIKGQLIAAFLPLKKLSIEFRQMAEATIDISKIIKIFDIPKLDVKKTETAHGFLSQSTGERGLELKDISFEYDDRSPIFSGLSYHIKAGEKFVIMGENGTGKSTLACLLGGLYKPSKGEVTIDGIPLQHYSEALLARKIHCIPQDLRLFNLSLYDNLSHGTAKISKQALDEAIELMEIDSIIRQLKHGLHTRIGEMGIRLSGGEKQRVALARAYLQNPNILVCDETLQSLTIEGETRILSHLSQKIETIIVVSHRKCLFPLMNRVLEIRNGKLLECGTESVLKSGELKQRASKQRSIERVEGSEIVDNEVLDVIL